MKGLAGRSSQLALITSPQGEVLFCDTLKCLAIQDYLPEKPGLFAFWPEKQHQELAHLLDKAAANNLSNECTLYNGYLDSEFIVEPYLLAGSLQALFWYCQDADNAMNLAEAPHCLVDLSQLRAFLEKNQINSLNQLDQLLKKASYSLAQLSQSIDIVMLNHACNRLLTKDNKLKAAEQIFSQQDVFHLASMVLNSASEGQFDSFADDCSMMTFYQKLTLRNINNKTSSDFYWLAMKSIDLYPTAVQHNVVSTECLWALVEQTVLFYDFDSKQIIPAPEPWNIASLQAKTSDFLSLLDEHDYDLLTAFDHDELVKQLNQFGEYHFQLQFLAKGVLKSFEVKAGLFSASSRQTHLVILMVKDSSEFTAACSALTLQKERYDLVADQLSDIILTLNTDEEIDYLSRSATVFLAGKSAVFLEKKALFKSLGLTYYQKRIKRIFALALRNKTHSEEFAELTQAFEVKAKRFDGQVIALRIYFSILMNEFAQLKGLLVVGKDITIEKASQANRQLAEKVFAHAHDAIYITDTNGLIVQVNSMFYRQTGYSSAEVLYKKPSILSSGWNKIGFKNEILPILLKKPFWEGELLCRKQNGEAFLALIRITALKENKEILGYITSFKDITEVKNSEEDIKKLAYFDPLTELPNRALFEDRLNQALQRGGRNRLFVSILFLDLDGFKAVNDKHGHDNGDKLLAEVAKRLKNAIRSDDTVARMGGDEFTLILNALPDQQMAQNASIQIANKIIQLLAKPFIINKAPIKIGCSIGIALYPDDSIDAKELIRQADTAMYHAKQSGKNNFKFFTFDLSKQTKKRHDLERDLLDAQFSHDFSLHYRTVKSLTTRDIIAYACHIQWRHPSQGVIQPQIFMPMVDDLALSDELSGWLINKACSDLKSAETGTQIIIPVFERHYQTGKLINTLKKAIDHFNVSASCIQLEFSQEMIMADVGFAYAILSDLKALHFSILVSDFASSFMSLQSLQRLPIDKIKLDQSIAQYIDKKTDEKILAQGILALADCFNYGVVVDGVTREQQKKCLLKMAKNNQKIAFCHSNKLVTTFETSASHLKQMLP